MRYYKRKCSFECKSKRTRPEHNVPFFLFKKNIMSGQSIKQRYEDTKRLDLECGSALRHFQIPEVSIILPGCGVRAPWRIWSHEKMYLATTHHLSATCQTRYRYAKFRSRQALSACPSPPPLSAAYGTPAERRGMTAECDQTTTGVCVDSGVFL